MEATIMIVWILVGLIGAGGSINIEVGDDYRTEKECNAVRNAIIAELPEGKPLAVGCVAMKVKAA